MPARNIIKTYVENGYYHIYNRGVEKRDIFLDKQDCVVFQRYLKLYLSPPEEVKKMNEEKLNRFLPLNMHHEIDLLSFALMPNHIHLFIKQYKKDSIVKFMRRLTTSYVMYFNRKHKRVGSLFQNRYKAALVTIDPYLLHLSRYIHLNPSTLKSRINFKEFNSYPYYLGEKQASWVKPQEILNYFSTSNTTKKHTSYESFVETAKEYPAGILGDLTLEKNIF